MIVWGQRLEPSSLSGIQPTEKIRNVVMKFESVFLEEKHTFAERLP